MELPANRSDELCPKCLLKAGLETQPTTGPAGTIALHFADEKSRLRAFTAMMDFLTAHLAPAGSEH